MVMRNNAGPGRAVTPPVHSDGTSYRYCMYFRGGHDVAFANTYLDLLDAMLPRYARLDEIERLNARIGVAHTVAAWTQGRILAELDEGDVSEEELRVLQASRGRTPPHVGVWSSEVAYVVVETSFEPFTDIPRPIGRRFDGADSPNLWWICPADEEAFLISLHLVGHVTLMENTERG